MYSKTVCRPTLHTIKKVSWTLTATSVTDVYKPFTQPVTFVGKGERLKSEHRIQSEIMLAVSKAGCTIIRTNVGKVIGADGRVFIAGPPKGWPDLTGFRWSDGKMILIEVKNDKGQLRPDQKKFAEFIKNKPVLYGVARSAKEALAIVEKDEEMPCKSK